MITIKSNKMNKNNHSSISCKYRGGAPRAVCALLLGAGLMFAGCDIAEQDPGAGPSIDPTSTLSTFPAASPASLVVGSKQSACKGTPSYAGGSGALSVKVQGNSATITHTDAVYNCASKITMKAALAGQTIKVQEVISNPDEQAFCVCEVDLTVDLKNLAVGSYSAQVSDAQGQLVGTVQFTVTGQIAAPTVGSTLQSACKGSPYGSGSLASGTVKATLQGGSLVISHDDAIYNCAAKVSMGATVSGSVIKVQETITNPGVVANCICTFDLSVEIKALAAGTYTVDLYDSDGNLAGTLSVVVP